MKEIARGTVQYSVYPLTNLIHPHIHTAQQHHNTGIYISVIQLFPVLGFEPKHTMSSFTACTLYTVQYSI